jgi:hypothetical protein
MSISATSHVHVRATGRRQRAVELRLSGATYRVIADDLGVTRQAAHKYVKQAMAVLNAKLAEDAEALRRLELERLDQLQAALWPAALEGNSRAALATLKVMDARAKLVGLYAPSKLHVQSGPSALDGMNLADLREEARRHGIPVDDSPAAPAAPALPAAPAPLPTWATSPNRPDLTGR